MPCPAPTLVIETMDTMDDQMDQMPVVDALEVKLAPASDIGPRLWPLSGRHAPQVSGGGAILCAGA